MDTGTWLILWGSPVGIAVFFAGLGVLLWGVAKLKLSEAAKAEGELEQRQSGHERMRGTNSAGSPSH
jgi:type IV secretory pathway TrbD component